MNLRFNMVIPPPLLKVRTQNDVLNHFLSICDDPVQARQIGAASCTWFDTYNGLALAQKWVDLLKVSTETEIGTG